MIRLLIKAFVFLTPLVIGALWLEHRLTWLPNSCREKRLVLREYGPTARVAVFGASHELFGIMPNELACPAVNLANASQSIFCDAQLVLRYLPEMKDLRLVIFGVSFFSFEHSLTAGEGWRVPNYDYFLDLPREAPTWLPDPRGLSLALTIGPRLALVQAMKPMSPPPEQVPERGWMPGPGGQAPLTPQAGLERRRKLEGMMNAAYRTANIESLERALEALRQRGVQVVFVTLPIHETCWRDQTEEIRVRFEAELQQLSTRFDARHFDYTQDARFTDADFTDVDHLNRVGAEKFSRVLRDEVVRPSGACSAAD